MTTADQTVAGSAQALWRRHRTFVLYAVIGSSGITLDLLLFLVLYNVAGLHEQVATAISTTIGIGNNFLLNSYLNFRRQDGMLRRFLRFYAVGLMGIGLTVGLLALLSTGLGIDPNIVKIVVMPAVAVLQFTLNKRWSFG